MKVIIQHDDEDAANAPQSIPSKENVVAESLPTPLPLATPARLSASNAVVSKPEEAEQRPKKKRAAVLRKTSGSGAGAGAGAGAASGSSSPSLLSGLASSSRSAAASTPASSSSSSSSHAYPLGSRIVHNMVSSSSAYPPISMSSVSSSALVSSSSSSSARPFLSSSSAAAASSSCSSSRMQPLESQNGPLRSRSPYAGVSVNSGALKTRLKRQGLEIKKMLGDGNCLFRAVSTQIYGDADWHGDIRKHVVKYLKSEQSYFSQFITEDFDEYIARMGREGCFGTNLEIQAIAEVYNRAVEVYGADAAALSSSSSNATNSSSASSSAEEKVKPINIFQSSYATSNAPIRLAYINGNHYDAVIDPYEATVGVGLGLPKLNPGGIEKANMKLAFEKSKRGMKDLERFCINKKMYLTDRQETENALEEAAIAASLKDYWETQGKGKLKRKAANTNCGANKKSKMHSSSTSSSTCSTSQSDGSLLSSLATTQARLTKSRQYPPAVEELIFNGFPPEKVLSAYETCGDNFDALLALVLRRT